MIVAGFGFRAAANIDSLQAALRMAAGSQRITALAAPTDKAQAASLAALGAHLNLPVHAVSARSIEQAQTLTNSSRIKTLRGTGSVAEAAALAVAGPNARLLAPRQISPDRLATCAVAIGEQK